MNSARNFWKQLTIVQSNDLWSPWLNTLGEDGSTIEDADSVSFINKELKRAIIINYQPDDLFAYSIWVEKFSDDLEYPESTIEVLVIGYRDISATLSLAKGLFTDWQNANLSYEQMNTKLIHL